jgi:putative ABC transport system permease protein
MRISHIALRNVREHLSRSALMLLVIAATVGIVCVLYLVTRSAERDLANKVDAYGANIVVTPQTKDLPLTYGGVSLGGLTYDVRSLRMADLEKIRAIPNKRNINKVAPKLIGAVDVRGVRLLGAGVDWKEELALKKWWQIDGSRPQGDHDVLLGHRAAARLGLQPGAGLPLDGETFRVAGILAPTGTQEDDLLYLDLATAQRLWKRPGEISLIEVSAFCSTCPIEEINAQISTAIPTARVSALLKAVESRRLLIDQFRLFSAVLSGLMILVGCLIVLSSTLAGVRDRRGEIGIFRAIGYRRQHIFTIILVENLALACLGGLVGVLLAALAAGPLARAVAGVSRALLPSPGTLVLALAASVGVVLVASLYPAWQASRLSPTLAMRPV